MKRFLLIVAAVLALALSAQPTAQAYGGCGSSFYGGSNFYGAGFGGYNSFANCVPAPVCTQGYAAPFYGFNSFNSYGFHGRNFNNFNKFSRFRGRFVKDAFGNLRRVY